MIAKKNVIILKYRTRQQTAENRQKLLRASRDEIIPKANAEAVVSVVIVMAGPAVESPL